jgi:hydroxymethylpyrimidine pyrophosphatase-like HAD family hydrolase
MRPIRLLSLDFDGTLVSSFESTSEEITAPDLVFCLRKLRKRGVLFALNTGRTLPLVDQALEVFPVRPDYALTAERELFAWDNDRWENVGDWNDRCRAAHDRLAAQSTDLRLKIEDYVEQWTGARLYYQDGRCEGVVARDNGEMDQIEQFLQQERSTVPDFAYQRNHIYLRFCHQAYDKGSVLGELQRILGIPAAETFAAGDNFNDLPMLSPAFAGWLACPANSIAEVKSLVARHGGFVAARESGAGVAEALRSFIPQLGQQGNGDCGI